MSRLGAARGKGAAHGPQARPGVPPRRSGAHTQTHTHTAHTPTHARQHARPPARPPRTHAVHERKHACTPTPRQATPTPTSTPTPTPPTSRHVATPGHARPHARMHAPARTHARTHADTRKGSRKLATVTGVVKLRFGTSTSSCTTGARPADSSSRNTGDAICYYTANSRGRLCWHRRTHSIGASTPSTQHLVETLGTTPSTSGAMATRMPSERRPTSPPPRIPLNCAGP